MYIIIYCNNFLYIIKLYFKEFYILIFMFKFCKIVVILEFNVGILRVNVKYFINRIIYRFIIFY